MVRNYQNVSITLMILLFAILIAPVSQKISICIIIVSILYNFQILMKNYLKIICFFSIIILFYLLVIVYYQYQVPIKNILYIIILFLFFLIGRYNFFFKLNPNFTFLIVIFPFLTALYFLYEVNNNYIGVVIISWLIYCIIIIDKKILLIFIYVISICSFLIFSAKTAIVVFFIALLFKVFLLKSFFLKTLLIVVFFTTPIFIYVDFLIKEYNLYFYLNDLSQEYFNENISSGRIEIWDDGIKKIFQRNLFEFGESYYAAYNTKTNAFDLLSYHNSYIDLFLRYGIFFSSLFILVLILYFLFTSFNNKVLLGIIILLIYGNMETLLFSNSLPVSSYFFVLLGAAKDKSRTSYENS